jgi:hypothetical protein
MAQHPLLFRKMNAEKFVKNGRRQITVARRKNRAKHQEMTHRPETY